MTHLNTCSFRCHWAGLSQALDCREPRGQRGARAVWWTRHFDAFQHDREDVDRLHVCPASLAHFFEQARVCARGTARSTSQAPDLEFATQAAPPRRPMLAARPRGEGCPLLSLPLLLIIVSQIVRPQWRGAASLPRAQRSVHTVRSGGTVLDPCLSFAGPTIVLARNNDFGLSPELFWLLDVGTVSKKRLLR